MAGSPCYEGIPRFLDREHGVVPLKTGEERENWWSKNREKHGIAGNSGIAYSRVIGPECGQKMSPDNGIFRSPIVSASLSALYRAFMVFWLYERRTGVTNTLTSDTLCLGSLVLRAKLEVLCTLTHPDIPMMAGNPRFNIHAEFGSVP